MHTHGSHPVAAGKSSFELVDVKKTFDILALTEGLTFLDLACGAGKYALRASQFLGSQGLVYAVDLWEDGIDQLRKRAVAEGAENVRAMVADAGSRIPVEDFSVDVCFVASVLHDFVEAGTSGDVLREVRRVVKPGGRLAVIEFKKIDGPPGPPVSVRLSPEDVEARVASFGFVLERVVEVGPYCYLMVCSATPRNP
jgi:ubiquinone/menaquinone biosynthesis C-methylase UbiE